MRTIIKNIHKYIPKAYYHHVVHKGEEAAVESFKRYYLNCQSAGVAVPMQPGAEVT